ncbi:hypothetical protein MetMK1DRAFT_00018400 [Metallosphaera yellowstonensis MK1]|uniref:Uncharacterized protein n=1 Tax=Metallosphaera yellowstonensis MK1 TaxID=671065 RepID=H2C5L7_9CREN|nr:hypothetical protein MetMK1DRAFT_00018360 [Metallosphaera yellowstonensis MK1]EHP69094.1 hypothetical protein MetMK1DRAFT_00018400 [Metallosphaera yellowstonensis MK1]
MSQEKKITALFLIAVLAYVIVDMVVISLNHYTLV